MDATMLVRSFLPMGIIFGLKYVDLENPQIIIALRVLSLIMFAVQMSLWVWIKMKIQRTQDQTLVKVKSTDLQPSPKAFDGANGQVTVEEMTVQEYDSRFVKAAIQGVLMPFCITFGIHMYFGYAAPLVLQPTMGLFGLFTHRLARIHLLGQSDKEQELQRPWPKDPSFLDQFMDVKKNVEKELGKESSEPRKSKKENIRKVQKKLE
eukprot:TRINITY_DN855_c0_g1_i1.p1 TRINITY_DN855_c0_g1~~TRINITY_DN855_c0_g1_i1.p1  ORF type:complete len:236 (+),score=60.10 TRINITY_DN855_c0_g1_i1:90-710(+)